MFHDSYEPSDLLEQSTTSEAGDLIEAFLYFRAQLQHWIWRSKDGEKLFRELQAWRIRHPGGGDRRLISGDNSHLATELGRYLVNHQERWFFVRWMYWIFTSVPTWETMERGLSILLAVDKALVKTIEKPPGSPEKEAVNSEGDAEALLHYQSQHFHLEGSLTECLQHEFQRRPWFGFFRRVMGQIHQAIESYEKKKAHHTPLMEEPFQLVNPDILKDLHSCIQTYASEVGESSMFSEDTPLLPLNPMPTNALPWPHDIGASISKRDSWAWLKEKTSSLEPSEFSRREKLLREEINGCLETLNQCFSASSEGEVNGGDFSSHLEQLIRLLWDASYLEKKRPSWWRRQARGYTEDRDFWRRLTRLKNELGRISERYASQSGAGLPFSMRMTELRSLRHGSNDWLLIHRTIVQGFYQDNWLKSFERYEAWKSQYKDPSHATQGRELAKRWLELGSLFFEATRVLSQREASRCRQQLMMKLREFQQCLEANPRVFEEEGSAISLLPTSAPRSYPQPSSDLAIPGASVSLANDGSDSEDGERDPEEEMGSFSRRASSFLMPPPSASENSPFPMVLVSPLPSSSISPSTSGSMLQGEKVFTLEIHPDDMAFIQRLTTPYPQELRETPQGLELEERLKGLKETMLIVDYIRLLKLLRIFSHPDKATRFYTNLEVATQGFKALNALWSREEKRISDIYQGLQDGTLRPKKSISEQLDELEREFAKRRQELEEIAKELKAFQASCKEFNEQRKSDMEMLKQMFKESEERLQESVRARQKESEAMQRRSEAMKRESEAMKRADEEIGNRIREIDERNGLLDRLKSARTSSPHHPLPSSSTTQTPEATGVSTILEGSPIAVQSELPRRSPSPEFFGRSFQSHSQDLRSSPESPTRTP